MINESFSDESVTCPGCGGHKFLKSVYEKNCYVCINLYDTPECSTIISCYCPVCQKTYPAEDFEFDYIDEYTCTHCNNVHEGYSELQQEIEDWFKAQRQLDALRNILWGKK